MLQAHVQLKAEASLSFKALNKLENATYHILKWKVCVFVFFFFNKNFQKVKKKIKLIQEKKKAPVCFTGFKVLLCVQLPCVTTCRLRARSLPHYPFINVHFACLKFKISSVSQLTRNFLGLWHTEVIKWTYIPKKKKVQSPSELGLF